MDLLKDSWKEMLGLIALPIVGYFFGGKAKQEVELKKGNTDAVRGMTEIYDILVADFKERVSEFTIELKEVKASNKDLQKQFNEMYIQYAKEVEKSANWEKLHRELKDAYNELEKRHELLKKDHDDLKKRFANKK